MSRSIVPDLSTKVVWFLTGSQGLYGEETLRQVATQSQAVATGLAESADIPVTVVWKPVLTDSDAIRRTMLDANSDDSVIGVIAWMHTFSPAKMWIAGLPEGRPLFVRTPDSRFTLANAMRAHLYGVFGTLALGMRVLTDENVALDRMSAHGGMFRTAGVAQRLLAGALNAPVTVAETASEGGAWGVAVLASFTASGSGTALAAYLTDTVFATTASRIVQPGIDDVAGFTAYFDRYRAGLAVELAAVTAL